MQLNIVFFREIKTEKTMLNDTHSLLLHSIFNVVEILPWKFLQKERNKNTEMKKISLHLLIYSAWCIVDLQCTGTLHIAQYIPHTDDINCCHRNETFVGVWQRESIARIKCKISRWVKMEHSFWVLIKMLLSC